MDSGTEQNLLNNLQGFLSNKTLFLVTQKMSLLQIVNRVIVLNDNQIYLDGEKNEVIKKLANQGDSYD